MIKRWCDHQSQLFLHSIWTLLVPNSYYWVFHMIPCFPFIHWSFMYVHCNPVLLTVQAGVFPFSRGSQYGMQGTNLNILVTGGRGGKRTVGIESTAFVLRCPTTDNDLSPNMQAMILSSYLSWCFLLISIFLAKCSPWPWYFVLDFALEIHSSRRNPVHHPTWCLVFQDYDNHQFLWDATVRQAVMYWTGH